MKKARVIDTTSWNAPDDEMTSAFLGERPGTGEDHYYLVVWNGHEFEVQVVRYTAYESYSKARFIDTAEQISVIHYPIDQRTKAKDWRRCLKAKPNEDNTAWLPDWDPDTMVDYEEELVGAAITRFQPSIDAAQVKVNEATNTVLRAQVVGDHKALVEFRDDAAEAASEWVQGKHIGWQDQHPHEAHIHRPLLLVIQETVRAWQTNRASDYSKVSARVAAIIRDLSNPHAYETRWDMDARLIREGHDPVGGYEHCFTIVASEDALTVDAALPDPTWPFDSLATATGGRIRGGQTYWDAEPTPVEARPWIHRFRRPIPEGTLAGADLGTVDWEFDAAYRPSN